jgi:hypothetical protein
LEWRRSRDRDGPERQRLAAHIVGANLNERSAGFVATLSSAQPTIGDIVKCTQRDRVCAGTSRRTSLTAAQPFAGIFRRLTPSTVSRVGLTSTARCPSAARGFWPSERLGGRFVLGARLSSTGVYPNHNRADYEKRDQRAQYNEHVHLFVRNKFRL